MGTKDVAFYVFMTVVCVFALAIFAGAVSSSATQLNCERVVRELTIGNQPEAVKLLKTAGTCQ